jgi:ABC-type multidrug transport system fused ATPase/permease subunit
MHHRCWQDPVVFSGTVRHNLDPVGRVAADAELWAAVRSAGLLETLQSLQVRSPGALHVVT